MTVLLSELSRCQEEMLLRSKSERKPERINQGEFTATNLRQVWQKRGRAVIISKHRKELPPKALLSIMWLSPSARCWLILEVEHKLTRIWSKTMTREVLIKSKSFRERFWKNLQVSRWGFQATPHHQPLLEATPGQLGFVHQRGSGSSHSDCGWKQVPAAHLSPQPFPEPPCQSQHLCFTEWHSHGVL